MGVTLELDGVRKAYGGFEVGPLDLTVGREVLSVLGPSGCGKTTLLWTIAGIVQSDGGTVTLDGQSLDGVAPEGRRIGLVFQDGALFPNMSVYENVAYASADPEYVAHLAEMLEIGDVLGRGPRTLSGGERQRVALARTLATEPDALLLDEPLSSLDAPIRRRLRDELYDLFRSLDVPVVLVTHDQRTATALSDRIAVLRDGSVEQVGPPSDILGRPQSRFVADFTGTENVFEADVVAERPGAVDLRVGDVTLTAARESPGESRATVCVHPSRVRVGPTDADASALDDATSDENAVRGTVRRWLNEGDEYRVVVGLDDADLTLTATVPPPAFERSSVDAGSSLRLRVSPDAIHLLPPSDGDQTQSRAN